MRTNITLADDTELQIVVTEEGIIMDHFIGNDEVSTVGMTFDEWTDWMQEQR